MKKIVWLGPYLVLFGLISCSNPQVIILTSQEETLRNEVQIKADSTLWTNELEPERLSSTINSNIKTSEKAFNSPQMFSTIKELQPAVYPEIKGLESLDCTAMNTSLLSTMDKFCQQLCKGTDNLKDFFFEDYMFNYVFFKNDLNLLFKEPQKDEDLFDRYLICRAFENENLTQVPVRFYKQKEHIDLSVYLTYHNGYKITQIDIDSQFNGWGNTNGESKKETTGQ